MVLAQVKSTKIKTFIVLIFIHIKRLCFFTFLFFRKCTFGGPGGLWAVGQLGFGSEITVLINKVKNLTSNF